LINITSAAIHEWDMAVNLPSYSLTKHSAALLMQLLAREKDPAQIQIISFHPGAILTPNIKSSGMDENTLNWDDGKSICPKPMPNA
jgi:NAD(P)-dependent dehydrogenase (short-subunit alcohol dehydrogenase family)